MLTFSERAAMAAVWVLLLVGLFFVGRAAWRRNRQQCEGKDKNRRPFRRL